MGAFRPTNGNSPGSSVSRELSRLDPFSFFVLPGGGHGVDHIVVGATGTFAITVGFRSLEDGCRGETRKARRGAKRVRRAAGTAAVHSRVQPLVCLPGRSFEAKNVRGVRVIPWGSLLMEIAGRSRTLTRHQAQRIAESLVGMPRLRPRSLAS
jgi:hypothetical protein